MWPPSLPFPTMPRLHVSCSPSSTATASAHPMLNSCHGPTLKLGAHLQTAQQEPRTIPNLNEVLALPHHCRSMGAAGASSNSLERLCNMNCIQDRLEHKEGGTCNFPQGDQNDRGKWAKPWRKGQMRGKMQDTWTSLPCMLAASLTETVQLDWSQQFTACKIFVSFLCGKATVCVSKFQSKPM